MMSEEVLRQAPAPGLSAASVAVQVGDELWIGSFRRRSADALSGTRTQVIARRHSVPSHHAPPAANISASSDRLWNAPANASFSALVIAARNRIVTGALGSKMSKA